jgi:GT2 family glycosyltransferase
VVDDGSRVPVSSIVSKFHHQLNITLIRQTNAGPGSARNAGVARAKGEFLAFTDDDCLPAPGWLKTLARHLSSASGCIVGGQTVNVVTDNRYAVTSQMLVSFLYHYYNADPNHAHFFTSNNMAIATQRFRTIGGFDSRLPAAGEDRELCDRWRHHGHKMLYTPEAVVYHRHNMHLKTFWAQHFAYGRSGYNFQRIRLQRGAGAVKIEPLSAFYLRLLQYPFGKLQKRTALLISMLLVIAQTANALGYFWERGKQMLPSASLGKIRKVALPILAKERLESEQS